MKENSLGKGERFNARKEASFLNDSFKRWDLEVSPDNFEQAIAGIRKFPRPIVVDFNNVLVNNESPIQVNPEARKFIKSLKKIGNVFIVTTAGSWDVVNEIMKKNRIWNDDVVLMTRGVWEYMGEDAGKRNYYRDGLIKDFLQTAKKSDWKVARADLLQNIMYKRVAPIFNKPFLVPIIDDASIATYDNPGMLGVWVKSYEPTDPTFEEYFNRLPERHTLKEAAEIVRQHYRNTQV